MFLFYKFAVLQHSSITYCCERVSLSDGDLSSIWSLCSYAKAQAECRRILEEQRAEWDEENRRLRETAAQEVQTLARERERFALELGQKHLQERQGGSQAGSW